MGARNRACVAENGRSIGQGEMDRWAQTSTGATCTMTLPGMPLPMLFLVEMSEAVEGKEDRLVEESVSRSRETNVRDC